MKFSPTKYSNLIAKAARKLMKSKEYQDVINILLKCRENGGIVFTMGCGGSASTATHFAADLAKTVGGFKAISLVDNIPLVSAITNDLGWEEAFDYQLNTWKIGPADVLMGFSVHGGSSDWSQNLVRAINLANKYGASTIGFTGAGGGAMKTHADVCLVVPCSDPDYNTPVAEGMHVVLQHAIIFDLKARLK